MALCELADLLSFPSSLFSAWTCGRDDDDPSGDVQLCDWSGLSCNPSGEVVSLTLSDQGLTKPLPDVFGSLGMLQKVDLSNNSFIGPLPRSFESLGHLSELSLGSNYFGLSSRRLSDSDSISSIFLQLQGLTNLRSLDLSDNGLSGQIPSLLCTLPLESLILDSVQDERRGGKNLNAFSCIAACLTENPELTLVVPLSLPICAVESAVPSASPTESLQQKSKSKGGSGGLDVVSISGITIGVAFFVLLFFCGLYAYLIRSRSAAAAAASAADQTVSMTKRAEDNQIKSSSLSEPSSVRPDAIYSHDIGSLVVINEDLMLGADDLELGFIDPTGGSISPQKE
jgi:hypothetical protein